MKNWTDAEKAELANLYHLANTALAGTDRNSPHSRQCWAASEYAKLHPEVSHTSAYKELCRQASWRY